MGASGRKPIGKRGRRLLLVAAALLVLFAAYGSVTAARLVFAYKEMVEAKDQLLSVEAVLREEGLDASPEALVEAEGRAMSARRHFHSVRSYLDGEPLLRVAAGLPLLGPQVEAARALADIGFEGSEMGYAGIGALRSFNARRVGQEDSLGEKVRAYLDSIGPGMAVVEERLADIRRERARIDGGWILPPLSGLVDEMDARLVRVEEAVDEYHQGRAVAHHFLGFDQRRRFLVLGLDNTELLPGGGLIGMFGVTTLEGGRVERRSFGEIAELFDAWQGRSGGEYIEPPGPLKRYLLRDWTWSLGVSNWSPDFPASARQALFFYDRSGADPVDGVIALDFVALEGLLAVLGPAEVPGYGVTVDSGNVTEEILARIGRPLRPQDGNHAFAAAVAAEVVDRALAADEEQWVPLLRALGRLAREKHFFLYAGDRRAQSAVRGLGWAGEVRDGPGDYLMAVNASVHSTKLNLVLEERVEVSVQLEWDGGSRNSVTLRYENRLDEWAGTHDPELVSRLMMSGLYGGYLRLLVPAGAELVDLSLNGAAVGAEEIAQESGKASFGRYLALPRAAEAALQFTYEVPEAAGVSPGGGQYRLLIQKQPGVRSTPLTVTFALPPGAKVESVSLDGQRLPGDPLVVETDLSVDRELTVRYEPS